jgi:hypothetical protein
MSSEFSKKLRKIKKQNGGINPDRSWVASNREQLLSSIKESSINNTINAKNKNSFVNNLSEVMNIFVSKRILVFGRVAMTSFLVFAVAAGGWTASVSASYNSLPGEVMYGVKMATEATELMVTSFVGSEEDEVNTILKHASTRVDEYQRSKSSEQATEAIKSLKKKIESTNETLVKAEKKSPVKAVAVAKVIEKKTDEILVSLTEESEESENSTSVSTKKRLKNKKEGHTESQQELVDEIDEAEDLIEQAGINAVEVIVSKVEKKEVGEDVMSKEEVKETINRKLGKLVLDVSKLDVEIGETNQLIASSTISVKILETVSSTESVMEKSTEDKEEESGEDSSEETEDPKEGEDADSSTEAQSKEEKTIADIIVVAEQKVSEANKKVEEAVEEVGNLIDQDNLSGALEKIKELEGVKSETKVIVVELSDAVDKVVEDVEESNKTEEVVDDTSSTSTEDIVNIEDPDNDTDSAEDTTEDVEEDAEEDVEEETLTN